MRYISKLVFYLVTISCLTLDLGNSNLLYGMASAGAEEIIVTQIDFRLPKRGDYYRARLC
jgi:hypothetical protein